MINWRCVTLVGPHWPVQVVTATKRKRECVGTKLTASAKETNDSKFRKSRMLVKPSIRSLTDCHAFGHALRMLCSNRFPLFPEEKLVVDLEESSDWLND